MEQRGRCGHWSLRGWTGRAARLDWCLDSGGGPAPHGEALDGGNECSSGLWLEETRVASAIAAAVPAQAPPCCVGRGAGGADGKLCG